MAAGAMDVFDALLMACAAAAAGRMSRAQCVSVSCDVNWRGRHNRHACGRVWQDVSSAELGIPSETRNLRM